MRWFAFNGDADGHLCHDSMIAVDLGIELGRSASVHPRITLAEREKYAHHSAAAGEPVLAASMLCPVNASQPS